MLLYTSMEMTPSFEPDHNNRLNRRIMAKVVANFRLVGRQLALSDQNPHEGRLRGSIIPSEYIDVPDTPPIHDDSV